MNGATIRPVAAARPTFRGGPKNLLIDGNICFTSAPPDVAAAFSSQAHGAVTG